MFLQNAARAIAIRVQQLCALSALLVIAAGYLLGTAQAATVNGLYDGTVRVKDRSDAARNEAFDAALAVVLVKVSGRTDAPNLVGAAGKNAQRYVQRYSYLAGGQLEVGFDGAAVNAMLEQVGLPLWDRDRPVTLVVYPNALMGLREAYMATEQTARLRGVPMIWANAQSSEQFPVNDLQQIQELAQRYDAAAVLLARPASGAVSAANLRWQMVFNGNGQERLGSAEDGPNLAADVLGRYYASAGKETVRLYLEVAGIENLDAYAKVTAYINGLLMVRGVAVDSLQKDVLRLRVELRGSEDSLRRTLAVDRKLVAVTAPSAINADAPALLSYRYNN